ncbi:MAG: MlaD family protein [Myxococcota bacterium]|nr:MlaD family protein [Myxococcota bacterium]
MTRQLKVGLFVIFGLACTMLAIFLIGSARQLWEPKVTYRTAFQDVAGLKPGAPVRMGGLDIGSVTSVGHSHDPSDPRIFVSLSISSKEAPRVREDTTARVANKGLLGDKMIELTVGSPSAPPIDHEKLVPSEEPTDMFAAANRVAQVAQHAIEQMQPLAQALGDPNFTGDIKGTAADVHSLLDAIVRGDGVMHRLFFDRRQAEELNELIVHLDRSMDHADRVLGDVQEIVGQVRQGPGIAHALLFDGELSKSAAGSVAELHEDLMAIRRGNGLAHELIYGDDKGSSQHVMSNLNAMSDDLRTIVSNVRQGRGTLGALLVDPTLYEDIKGAIGNVERNAVLRALVRYSIKADERRPPPRVEPAP